MGKSGPTVALCVFIVMAFGIYAVYVRGPIPVEVTKGTSDDVPRSSNGIPPKTPVLHKPPGVGTKAGVPAKGPYFAGDTGSTGAKLPVSTVDEKKRTLINPADDKTGGTHLTGGASLQFHGEEHNKTWSRIADKFMERLTEDQRVKIQKQYASGGAKTAQQGFPRSQDETRNSGMDGESVSQNSADESSDESSGSASASVSSSVQDSGSSSSESSGSASSSDNEDSASASDYESESASDQMKGRQQGQRSNANRQPQRPIAKQHNRPSNKENGQNGNKGGLQTKWRVER